VCYGKAELWDIATRKRLLTVPGISGDFSPDGERFATGAGDPEVASQIRVWETSSGRELLRFEGGDSASLASLTYSPDGNYIVAADVAGNLRTWDAHSGELLDHGPIVEESDIGADDSAPEPEWPVMTNSLGMQFVPIEPGEYFMGSPTSEAQRKDDELRHRVKITRPYYLGRFEVTQDEYALVTGKTPSHFSPAGERQEVVGLDTGDMPVERVTWNDAVDFCRRLSALPEERAASRTYRLPTEAEWEYACRAGTTTAFNVGDTLSPAQANFDATRPYGDVEPGVSLKRTRTVGLYSPNAWGLYDMHGNVWEWCQDGQRTYRSGTAVDPVGPTPDDKRSLRGSGFFLAAFEGRSGRRQTESVTWQAPNLGFRVVCEIKE
jgi:formylglycine-generating enzyme required for sulfatase activity